jgi:hypothetical protein
MIGIRRMIDGNENEFVNCRRDNSAWISGIEIGEIGTSAGKADPHWSTGNDH